jgi:hypothetical protein
MSVPKKTGASPCVHCAFSCKNEEYKLTHRFVGSNIDAELVFCSRDCMMEYFEEELFFSKIEAAIEKAIRAEKDELERLKTFARKEYSLFLQQVCPACKLRITRLLSRPT